MNDESIDREILSDRAAAEALQSIAGKYNYPGGNALLNVEVESVRHADKPASGNDLRFTTDGDYPISFEHTSDDDEDDLSLTNDVAIEEEESDLDR